jgi:hypothetical protein
MGTPLESAKAKPSLRVKKALVDSGAYTEEDFEDTPEPVNALATNKPSSVMKQVDQKTYDDMLKKQKAVQAEKYLKYKQGGNK